jgi:hypothetical protein
MVERLAEMIIPEDDTPGAKQAGVAEFIDFMLANRVPVSGSRDIRSTADAIEAGDDAQVRFISGLNWMNARSHSEFGHDFMDCPAEQQNGMLEELAYKDKFKPKTESGRTFFQMMRDYTVIGYYTTKIGLESIGHPGLADLAEDAGLFIRRPGAKNCPGPIGDSRKEIERGLFGGKPYDVIRFGTGVSEGPP